MFTGLVQSLAEVAKIEARPPGRLLMLRAPEHAVATQPGDSVAINGCCLTCVAIDGALLWHVPDRLSHQVRIIHGIQSENFGEP